MFHFSTHLIQHIFYIITNGRLHDVLTTQVHYTRQLYIFWTFHKLCPHLSILFVCLYINNIAHVSDEISSIFSILHYILQKQNVLQCYYCITLPQQLIMYYNDYYTVCTLQEIP